MISYRRRKDEKMKEMGHGEEEKGEEEDEMGERGERGVERYEY